MRKLAMAIAAGIAAVAIQAAPQRDGRSPARPAGNARHVQQQGQKAPKTAQKPSRGGTSRTTRHIIRRDDGRDRMDKRDRRLIERIEEADSPRELRRYMQEAAASREKAVRMAMVEALADADGRSPSDLAYFLSDPSEEVADAAFSAWTSALEDMKPHRRLREIAEAARFLQRGHDQPPPAMPAFPSAQPAAIVPAVQPVVAPQPVAAPQTVVTPQPVVVPAMQ